jgi:hypothetical protein
VLSDRDDPLSSLVGHRSVDPPVLSRHPQHGAVLERAEQRPAKDREVR